jgi:hypothetical protein
VVELEREPVENRWKLGRTKKKPPGLPAVGLVFGFACFTRACLSSRRGGARTKNTQKRKQGPNAWHAM